MRPGDEEVPSTAAAVAHVFAGELATPVLDDADRHHLERVLRLRAGEAVTVSDGAGRWRRCCYAGAGRLEVDGEVVAAVRAVPEVTVAFALTKGDRPEWTVQKLVEAGVDRIVVLDSARTVVRWDADKAPRRLARLSAVARGAAMQSRRVWLPVVEGPLALAAVLDAGPPGGVCMAHPGGAPPSLDRPTVLVGPEGGWDGAELTAGVHLVRLGTTILRAETAAMAAGLLLCALRAGVVVAAAAGGPGPAAMADPDGGLPDGPGQ